MMSCIRFGLSYSVFNLHVFSKSPGVAAQHNPTGSEQLNDLRYGAGGGQPEKFATLIESQIQTLGKVMWKLRVAGG